ncbi:hypothetical protein DQG23_12480 [Paenibacillus contaminans]|uniref:Uncharacterized protein n=1 Tax=Paenibacillus contaminans TaxID=450362 RepID=A0A329MLU3_9BACL|nr:hypothetical protein DQG23_12480 [Paenibacillus contaminans]
MLDHKDFMTCTNNHKSRKGMRQAIAISRTKIWLVRLRIVYSFLRNFIKLDSKLCYSAPLELSHY